jgi:HupE / UreJ protein
MKAAAVLLVSGALLGAPPAGAHIASNGFLLVRTEGQELRGSLELAVRDVELAVGVDANHDGKITWGELQAAQPRLNLYVGQHLGFTSRGVDCPLSFQALEVNDRVDGVYAWLPWRARCGAALRQVSLTYTLLHEVDPSHRGLVTLIDGTGVQTAVVSGREATRSFDLANPSRMRAFAEYFQAGAWHIWSGIDHLLFLLSLLLPAVLLRRDGHWQPVQGVRPALVNILKVVTAFTVAHSITLSLAAFGLVHLPSRLTESMIAASIIVAAGNNILPVVTDGRVLIAFGFGLLHGFGFASVLSEMGLPAGARVLSLLGFNLGIEFGQLAVVVLVMPLAYRVRGAALYERAVLPAGSMVIAVLASVWLAQRAFGV